MSGGESRRESRGAGGAGVELRTLAAAGPPGPVPVVTLDGIEVVQAVQDLNHTVPLIAGKRTLIRVYLSTGGVGPVPVRGTLTVRRVGAGGGQELPSMTDVVLNPADAGPGGLRRKRESLRLSLNFLLPPALAAGDVQVALTHLETVSPIGPLPIPAGPLTQVTFAAAVPLRIRVLGLRYQSSPAAGPVRTFEPAAIDYALVRSWLGRAYPVAQVEWSQTTVDWPGTPPWPVDDNDALATWGRDFVNPYLSALRAQDVAGGTDYRTHVFGLAADGGGFMRGWALTPAGPDPAAVGCGPAGRPTGSFSWDTDGSYADWYTGHELGHTFGRQHPGFCNNNSHDDPAFPYPMGQLSPDDGTFVGLDVGDPDQAIEAQALPGTQWHDVMTYCDRQWLSRYTYVGIYRRLLAEEALPTPGAAPAGGASPAGPALAGGVPMTGQPNGIHVVARVNRTQGTGTFKFVTPVAGAAGAPAPAAGDYVIRVRRAVGPAAEYPAPFRGDACGDPSDTDVTGSLDVLLPIDPAPTALELVHKGVVLDTFTPGGAPPDPTNIRSAAAGGGAVLASFPSVAARPKITWTPTPAAGAGAALAGAGPGPLYTVQVSRDDGQSWRTVGVGLAVPEATLDPHLLEGRDTVQVRVTATNGFRASTTTETLAVKDL